MGVQSTIPVICGPCAEHGKTSMLKATMNEETGSMDLVCVDGCGAKFTRTLDQIQDLHRSALESDEKVIKLS